MSDAGLAPTRSDWVEMTAVDPHWLVLSDRRRIRRGWDQTAFFETGRREVASVMSIARTLGAPKNYDRLLDYGCGLGRTTREFSQHFALCIGIDIAPNMASQAKTLNSDIPRCHFMTYDGGDTFPYLANTFDMVYASLVLQHLPDSETMKRRVAALLGLLRSDGLLCFQMPLRLPWYIRAQPRANLYRLLLGLGNSALKLYRTFGLHPFTTRTVHREEIELLLAREGAQVLAVEKRRDPNFNFESLLYFVRRSGSC